MVIVVIGILASITFVLYPGYQKRTRDNERKSDMVQIATALSAYALQKNNYVGTASGCGLGNNGNGWFNAGAAESAAGAGEGLGSYTKSIANCLEDVSLLRSGEFVDPLGCKYASGGQCGAVNVVASPAQAYMKVTCKKGTADVTYVLSHLENDPRKDAEVDALCDAGTVTGYNATTQKWGTRYGMNYYVMAK